MHIHSSTLKQLSRIANLGDQSFCSPSIVNAARQTPPEQKQIAVWVTLRGCLSLQRHKGARGFHSCLAGQWLLSRQDRTGLPCRALGWTPPAAGRGWALFLGFNCSWGLRYQHKLALDGSGPTRGCFLNETNSTESDILITSLWSSFRDD